LREGIAARKGAVLVTCVIIGLLAGLAAALLKHICDFIHHTTRLLPPEWGFWGAPLLPAIGILICVGLVALFAKGHYVKGLSCVIATTTKGTSDLPPSKCASHIVTSGVGVGLGGSAGLEAPIALTGAAIGSNIAKTLGLSSETRTLFLACGGAAGIAAVFNSPVGGALFACEVLLPAFSVPALVPLLMSSAAAAVLSSILYSKQPFIALTDGWNMRALPFYVLLGLFCGVIGAYVMRVNGWVSSKLEAYKNPWLRALVAGVALYLAFLLFPCLKGEGYSQVADIVVGDFHKLFVNSPLEGLSSYGWIFVSVVASLVLLKAAVSSASIEGGGDGGIFAPSMFIGAFAGLLLSRSSNLLGADLSEVNFIAVGMGGVLSGVMHAPMTGIFLIAEITGGYKLLIPLMIVSSLACFACRRIEPFNIYKRALNRAGFQLEPNPESAAMETLSLSSLVERDFVKLGEGDSLRDMLKAVMASKRNIFPVIDAKGRLSGIVTLDNLRPYLLDAKLYDLVLAYDVMGSPGPALKSGDSLAEAARLFEKCGLWNLPVQGADGRHIGFVSKSGVFDKYREMLRNKPELF
jgi:CIC family chloride channel protein